MRGKDGVPGPHRTESPLSCITAAPGLRESLGKGLSKKEPHGWAPEANWMSVLDGP